MRSMCRTALVALVAVLMVGVVASASASAALPEFQMGGKGLEKAVKFSVSSSQDILQSVTGETLPCLGDSMKGETHGASEVANVVITFKGCEANHNLGKCTTAGAKESGEVVSGALSGRLGYLSKSEGKAGLLLQPAKGEQIAECTTSVGKHAWRLRGSVIGHLTPKNEETTVFSLVYHQTSGVQEWSHFDGEEAVHRLEFTPWGKEKEYRQAGFEAEKKVTFEEAVEVKA